MKVAFVVVSIIDAFVLMCQDTETWLHVNFDSSIKRVFLQQGVVAECFGYTRVYEWSPVLFKSYRLKHKFSSIYATRQNITYGW